jgi:hypothetical protein
VVVAARGYLKNPVNPGILESPVKPGILESSVKPWSSGKSCSIKKVKKKAGD